MQKTEAVREWCIEVVYPYLVKEGIEKVIEEAKKLEEYVTGGDKPFDGTVYYYEPSKDSEAK